jgi:hypothetical protein
MDIETFTSWLEQQVPQWLGRPIVAGDGTALPRLEAAAGRLGIALAPALQVLFARVGEVSMLMRAFQQFHPPEHWRLEAGPNGSALVFLDENQGVCEWAVDDEGQVWQCIPAADGTCGWHAESLPLPEFLTVVLPYQLAQGGWPFTGMASVPADEYADELAALAQDLGWPCVASHNGLTIHGQGAAMLWGLQPIPGEDDGMLLERLDFTEL